MVLTDRLRIVVAVLIVRTPFGAQTWHYLDFALGLARMGHDVIVVEDSDDHEWTCWNPVTAELGTDASYGLAFTAEALNRVGLGDQWAYFDAHGAGWTGPRSSDLAAGASDADLFINISGVNVLRPWFAEIPRRVFLDTDPGFVQARNLTRPPMREATERHNVFMTFGENIDDPDCCIPRDGFDWRPTRQPVVLSEWQPTAVPAEAPFTTIMKWDSYRPQEVDGLVLGMKSHSFEPYFDLPRRTSVELELAIGAPYPMERLRGQGWRVTNPQVVAPDPWSFQQYVASSTGEFTVAKHGYVVTQSGWFSERSAHYLASGRPVITQETGFSKHLPTGEGLLSFSTPDEALTALEAVSSNPARHGRAAREIAVEYFDHERVLGRFLDDVMR